MASSSGFVYPTKDYLGGGRSSGHLGSWFHIVERLACGWRTCSGFLACYTFQTVCELFSDLELLPYLCFLSYPTRVMRISPSLGLRDSQLTIQQQIIVLRVFIYCNWLCLSYSKSKHSDIPFLALKWVANGLIWKAWYVGYHSHFSSSFPHHYTP